MHLDCGTRELYLLEIVQPLFFNSFCIDDWEWLIYKSAFCSYCQVWLIHCRGCSSFVLKKVLRGSSTKLARVQFQATAYVGGKLIVKPSMGTQAYCDHCCLLYPLEKLYVWQTPKLYNHRGVGGLWHSLIASEQHQYPNPCQQHLEFPRGLCGANIEPTLSF